MRDIYYHLGLHKTGTTFLQNKYFAKLPITYYKGGQSFIKVIESFSNTNDKILISDENFSGQLFSLAEIVRDNLGNEKWAKLLWQKAEELEDDG